MIVSDEAYFGDESPMTIRQLINRGDLPGMRYTYARPQDYRDNGHVVLVMIASFVILSMLVWWIKGGNIIAIIASAIGVSTLLSLATASYLASKHNMRLVLNAKMLLSDPKNIILTNSLVERIIKQPIPGELYMISLNSHQRVQISTPIHMFFNNSVYVNRGDGEGKMLVFFRPDTDTDRVLFKLAN